MPLEVPTATLLTDSRNAPVLREQDGRRSGTRVYRVNTHEEFAALNATGLPRKGDAWDANLPLCTARNRTTQYLAGTDQAATGVGGLTLVTVEYAEPGGFGAAAPVPTVNEGYTELQTGVSTVQVMFPVVDVDPNFVGPPYLGPPLANGQGFSVEVATLVALVHCFRPLSEEIPLATLLALTNKVNTNEIFLPSLYGSPHGITLDAGQARYRGFTPRANGGTMELIHELVLASDHVARWQVEDEHGKATGDVLDAKVYADFLFPANWTTLDA